MQQCNNEVNHERGAVKALAPTPLHNGRSGASANLAQVHQTRAPFFLLATGYWLLATCLLLSGCVSSRILYDHTRADGSHTRIAYESSKDFTGRIDTNGNVYVEGKASDVINAQTIQLREVSKGVAEGLGSAALKSISPMP